MKRHSVFEENKQQFKKVMLYPSHFDLCFAILARTSLREAKELRSCSNLLQANLSSSVAARDLAALRTSLYTPLQRQTRASLNNQTARVYYLPTLKSCLRLV
jgi:hypothetical protein